MVESRSGIIKIQDIEQDVFEDLLHFIYTCKAPNIEKNAQELLIAADKGRAKNGFVEFWMTPFSGLRI